MHEKRYVIEYNASHRGYPTQLYRDVFYAKDLCSVIKEFYEYEENASIINIYEQVIMSDEIKEKVENKNKERDKERFENESRYY